jgi:ribosome-associated protein
VSTRDDDVDDAILEPPPKLTRIEQRHEAMAYAELAERLSRGKHLVLSDPPFDDALQRAIQDAQRLVKSARSRQIRRVAQLLRGAGTPEQLRDLLKGRMPGSKAARVREQANELWRTRLLTEGDAALTEFLAAYPHAERKRVRQLMRQANRTPPDPHSKKASRTLIREIRAILDVARITS